MNPSPHRRTPPLQIVIPDTNALWVQDKEPPVAPKFDIFWEENKSYAPLKLVLPSVVRGELLFQQTSSSWKAFSAAVEKMEHVSRITGKSHKIRTKKSPLKGQVAAKLDRWLQAKGGIYAEVPIKSIDWNRLIERAVWREPPFEEDGKNKTEKGFRDALILETIVAIASKEKSPDANIAFLCNDGLLEEAARKRLKHDSRFSVYSGMEAYSSFLRLTHEELSKEFIDSIIGKASKKFFVPQKESTLFFTENIIGKIREKHEAMLEDPFLSVAGYETVLPGKSWKPRTSGRYWIDNSTFRHLEEERLFFWSNRVSFVRVFEKPDLSTLTIGSTPHYSQRILILEFEVEWKARVKSDGRFYEVGFEQVALVKNEFRSATKDEERIFGLGSLQEGNA